MDWKWSHGLHPPFSNSFVVLVVLHTLALFKLELWSQNNGRFLCDEKDVYFSSFIPFVTTYLNKLTSQTADIHLIGTASPAIASGRCRLYTVSRSNM